MSAVAKPILLLFGLFLLTAENTSSAQTPTQAEALCKDAKTQREMNECLAAAYQKADEELNVFYSSLRKKIGEVSFKKLQEAQRAWLKYRDANCEADSALYEGGSIQSAMRSGCLERVTRGRIAELHIIYDTGTR